MYVPVLFLDLIQPFQNPVRHIPGGIAGLLLDLEENAVFPVYFCVGLIRIVLPLHIRDVGKPDGVDTLPLYKYQIAQLFYRRKLVAHANEEVNAVLLHIACRHVEILRGQ